MHNIQDKSLEAPDYMFKELFPHSNPALVQLLEEMFTFNPYMRPTAKQLLKSKVFQNIRQSELEKPAPYKFVISADKSEEFK